MESCSRFYSRVAIIVYIFIAFVLLKYLENRTCIYMSFDDKFFRRLLRYSRILMVCLYFYCEYKNGFDKKKIIRALLFISIFSVAGYYSKSWSWVMFDLLLIPVLFSNYVSFQKIANLSFYCFSFGTICIIAFHYLNLIPDVPFSRNDSMRYALSFSHPNNLGLFLMLISMTSVFFFKKASWLLYALIAFLLLFSVIIPKSYTPAYIMFFLLLGLPFAIKMENKDLSDSQKRLFLKIFITVFIVCVLALYLISYFRIGESFISSLPGALWARFELGYRALCEFGFSVVGQSVHLQKALFETDSNLLIIDCAYFFMPIVFGVIPTLFYFYMFYLSVKQSVYNQNFRLFLIQCLALIYGVSETMIFNPYFIFIFLGTSLSVYKRVSV